MNDMIRLGEKTIRKEFDTWQKHLAGCRTISIKRENNLPTFILNRYHATPHRCDRYLLYPVPDRFWIH